MEWHCLDSMTAVRRLDSDIGKGLTCRQAEDRLKTNGYNILKAKKKTPVIIKFLMQFSDFTVIILLLAAVISFAADILSGNGDLIDPIMILLIVIVNSVIGTVQECRAEKAIDALKKLSSPHSAVIRGGIRKSIPSEELAPGDIIEFKAGDLISADARLIEAVSLKADEASLTGEAVPADKDASAVLPEKTPPADRVNMLYASTYIVSGHGKAVVTSTGMDTEVGRIASMLDSGESPRTPLQKSLAKTGKLLGTGAIIICLLIFGLGLLQNIPPADMFMISISLAVAAIPEGLPAIVTIVLAMGVRRLAARKAVVRRLPAVETLGSANVICSDKTGTLTVNKMTVEKTEGTAGELSPHSREGAFILSLMALCSNASMQKKGNSFYAVGEPTEAAILNAAQSAGKNKDQLDRQYPRTDEIPFDSRLKRMVTVHSLPSGGYRIIAKGAPDILAELCTDIYKNGSPSPMTGSDRKSLLNRNENLASQGMRVIAAAFRDVQTKPDKSSFEKGLCFAGMAGLSDPPRKEAYGAVAQCKKAGIKTVMITGDHISTAKAIASKLGIMKKGDKAATGAMLDSIPDEELRKHIFEYSVFARVSPGHKVRIVKAFQSAGAIAAMTGDGVNDAPALKCADIGCAMGQSGTEAAKSAADMVLTDDNFATIVNAVEQGRGIFDNIRRTIHFLLSSNIGEILTVLCAFLMKLPPPLLAIQLLWVNLVTDSLPALALGSEPASAYIMEKPPEKTSEGIFGRNGIFSIIIEGCFIGALSFLAYTVGRIFFDGGGEPVTGRTMTFAVLSLSQLVHSFNLRSSRSLFKTGILGNPSLILAFIIGAAMQISVISIPPLAAVFKAVPLSPEAWLITLALSLVPIPVVEAEKLIFGREDTA